MQPGLRHAHLNRWLALLPHHEHRTARRPRNDISRLVILAGTLVAERRDRSVDEPRIQLGKRIVAEAERIEVAERERLDQEIGALDQLFQQLAPVGIFEVERDRSLAGLKSEEIQAAVQARLVVEEGRDLARRASLGGSTLITSAPMSANILPQSAPFSSLRSSIRNPLSSSERISQSTSHGYRGRRDTRPNVFRRKLKSGPSQAHRRYSSRLHVLNTQSFSIWRDSPRCGAWCRDFENICPPSLSAIG